MAPVDLHWPILNFFKSGYYREDSTRRRTYLNHLDSLWLWIWDYFRKHQIKMLTKSFLRFSIFILILVHIHNSKWHILCQKVWIWARIRIRIKNLRPLLACNYPPITSQKWSQILNQRLPWWWTSIPWSISYWRPPTIHNSTSTRAS
jgi:hypothetical protein